MLHLDDTDLAVDAALAADLLPLWQAVQSLSASDTASTVEINAVINQIEKSMSSKQIAAIAAMKLTSENLSAMMTSGELQLEFAALSADDGGASFAIPDGAVPEGAMPEGGMPGDDFAPAVTNGNDVAANQADGESSDFSWFQERVLVSAAVRLLEEKIS